MNRVSGKKRAKRVLGARELALEALIQIEQGGAYSNLLLHQLFQQNAQLDPRDRRLITELVYGTLQQQKLLDFHLQPFVRQPLDKLEDWVKQLFRLSIYQFLFLDRIPDHAVVHEAVEIAKKRGHRGTTAFVNGVLRNFLRSPRASLESITDPVERLAVETSHPTWLVRRWINQWGLETAGQMLRANNTPAPFTIRVNRLKTSRAALMDKLLQAGYKVQETTQSPVGLIVESAEKSPGSLTDTELYQQGYFTIQDESSMLVAPLLAPEKGMKVLDACSAPGGKTTHIAELMDNQGYILAVDVHAHKQRLIEASSRRLGISIIETKTLDARQLPDWFCQQGIREPIFDRILLDAPCTGLGVIRRKPDLKWKKKEEDIARIKEVQFELLTQVSKLLKVGGQLVYSTCTIEKEENERQIARFLEAHPQFICLENSTRQILPHHFGSDGFFMTKLQKVGDHV